MHREEGLNAIEQPLAVFPHTLFKSGRDVFRYYQPHHRVGRLRDIQRVKQRELFCPGQVFQGVNGFIRIIRSVNRE